MVEGTQPKPTAAGRTKSPGRVKPKEAEPANGSAKSKPEKKDEEKEFGGPVGAFAIMAGSHVLMPLMAASLYGWDWQLFVPTRLSLGWFLSYHFSQWAFACIMPGPTVTGPSGLKYLCNAYSSFYATMALSGALHVAGIFDLTTLVKQYPAFLMTAILLGDLYSVVCHLCHAKGREIFSIYDFFIGTALHPRVGMVDVKMVAETRLSWTLLLLCTIGAYIESYRRLGTLLNPSAFMVLAHGLYGNACAKGEHFIPYTWDITTEKFGWMLCWWNLAGVPLLYCYNSLYLAHHTWSGLVLPPIPVAVYYGVLSVCLVIAYCIWDKSQYEKCYFKMEQRGGELLNRNLFPTFGHIENPKYIKCDVGVLLIDGFWAKARKIHYTADTAMAIMWGLCCGFGSFLPYFYCTFFLCMITHRAGRDEARCRQKYGKTWDEYLKTVPYRFIPGIF
mmetsp:Transcript_130664/g.378004  ORF Transcript_130664/g.378004 Transcript_130664/m.378004 type:complete len:446 (-) Transcript_130664:80-1417(-)